jgi:hypothetical protein
MIKPSDIIISVYKDTKAYRQDTVVQAELVITEVATVYRDWANESGVIDRTKEMVKHALYQRMYGELRDSIEEMYAIAMVKMPNCQELDKVREAKKKIDRIMRGET